MNSLAGVAREKGALYRGMRPNGTIVVNLDDPWVRKSPRASRAQDYLRQTRLGARAGMAYRGMDGMQLKLKAGQRSCNVKLNYLGQHNIANALGAAALTLVLVRSWPRSAEVGQSRPFSMRMKSEDWRGLSIINDAYNANPRFDEAALQTLRSCPAAAAESRWLGDMFELGKQAAREHRQLAKPQARGAVDFSTSSATEPRWCTAAALAAGMSPERVHRR